MDSLDSVNPFLADCFSQLCVFKSSIEASLNRGYHKNGFSESWYRNNTTSCEGYSKIVYEDGQIFRFKEGRIVIGASNGVSGDIYSIHYMFKMKEYGEGYCLGLLGRIYGHSVKKMRVYVVGEADL